MNTLVGVGSTAAFLISTVRSMFDWLYSHKVLSANVCAVLTYFISNEPIKFTVFM